MNSSANPGIWGLNASTMSLLSSNDCICEFLVLVVNAWVNGDQSADLLLSVLSAIPKPHKPTLAPEMLRPISVTSSWYRLIAKVFTMRLESHLLELYSTD